MALLGLQLLGMQCFTMCRELESSFQVGNGQGRAERGRLAAPLRGDPALGDADRPLPCPGLLTCVSVCMIKVSFLSVVEFGFECLDWGEMNFRSCSPRKP